MRGKASVCDAIYLFAAVFFFEYTESRVQHKIKDINLHSPEIPFRIRTAFERKNNLPSYMYSIPAKVIEYAHASQGETSNIYSFTLLYPRAHNRVRS